MIATTQNTANQQQQSGSIFKMFYTHKRCQILLEDGWVNAAGEKVPGITEGRIDKEGNKVPGVRVKRIEKVSTTADYTDKKTGEVTTKFLNCVHVIYINNHGKRCSTFISCLAFVKRANFKRREESENYKAYQNFSNATQWSVYPVAKGSKTDAPQNQSDIKGNVRTVHTVREGVFCDCEDFNNQEHYLKQHPYLWNQVMKQKRICKHSYAALNVLQFSSLNDYMKAVQPGGRLDKLSAVMNKTTR